MRAWLAAPLVLIIGAAAADAQVIRVAGTITDEAGQPVRGAAITAENPDQTPPRLTATSNAKGEFGFIGVRRGMWTLTVEAPGFERIRFRHAVTPGHQQPIDVRLAHTPAPVTLPLDGVKAADIQQRIARAESLAAGGDVDAAIAAWSEVLSKLPALTSVHMQIGALYERKPDPARALATYRRLLELEPGNTRAQAAVERLGKHD
jgi:tetratricopeptide (TPR) repeat protein